MDRVITSDGYKKVLEERNELIQKELDMMLGSDLVLNDKEQLANKIIMKLKEDEVDNGFRNPQEYNFTHHFFKFKEEVRKSELFKIIQSMPKGAVLHAHDTAILGPDYVLSLTYLDNLYVCFDKDNVNFTFSSETPKESSAKGWQLLKEARNLSGDVSLSSETPKKSSTKGWQLLKEARYMSGDVEKFDADLRKHFTLVIDNPNEVYTDVNAVWKRFQNYFITTGDIFCYKPVWEQYFYDTLKAFREDNVMYLEIRSVLPELYDLNGTKYNSIDTAASYKSVLDRFMNDYPDFLGAKLIYAPLRCVDSKTVKDYINIARKLKEMFPDFFIGFDLVGQEDLGAPTKEFLHVLSDVRHEFDFFFHAGETNWSGTSSDENLVDAIVLDCKRIGHGCAIVKHPLLMEEIKKRNIALEVNVISNAVLKLVEDVRNHPLAVFFAKNLPLVISCDDPGIWEADPMSHDFYVAFVGVASRHADLRLLKKLALNSLHYSKYPDIDKLVREFEIRWSKFIDSLIKK